MSVKKIISILVVIVSITLALFHIYTSTTGLLEPLLQRPIHLALILGLAFLVYPRRKEGKIGWLGIILSILGLVSVGYIAYFYEDIIQRSLSPTGLDIFFGVISIILLVEATRRTNGWPLIILTGLFLFYAYFGPMMPEVITHAGYSFEELIYYMFMTTEGIFALPLGVAATYIYLFILFGAVLEKTGMGEFLNDLAMAMLGRYSGGPA